MIDVLTELEKQLPEWLEQPELWNTLMIDYRPPKVERLWRQVGEYRLFLHCIYPCTKRQAFFHPHKWPSAVKILRGGYEMGVGFGKGIKRPKVSHTIYFGPGSGYEMLHRDAWHYVRPVDGPSFSTMITGKPWRRAMPDVPSEPLSALPEDRFKKLRQLFLRMLAKPARAAAKVRFDS